MNARWAITMIALGSLLAGAIQAQEAQDPPQPAAPEARYQDRNMEREQWSEGLKSMSGEEPAAARAEQERRREENRVRQESMSDEERGAASAEREKRQEEQRARRGSMWDQERDSAKKRHRDRGGKGT